MAIITIGTPFNIDLEFRIATFNKRLVAWLVDISLICAYYYLMLRFLYPLMGMDETIRTAAGLFIIIIPVLAYQLVFELLFNGQTVGKMLTGIQVIDMEGHEPTWGQYITRWVLCIGNLFVYIIPYIIMQHFGLMIIFLVLYLPDFLSVVISGKSQRIGDFAAGTVVIDKRYVADINETIYQNIENENYQPMFADVMRLSDRDINGIRNLLNNTHKTKETEAYIFDVAQRIQSVLNIETTLHPVDFLQQLLRDYNYYTANAGS
jgi:uncharacterized RDD family membrane protein YckC